VLHDLPVLGLILSQRCGPLAALRAAAESGESGGAPIPDVVGVVDEAGVGEADADVVAGVVARGREEVADGAVR